MEFIIIVVAIIAVANLSLKLGYDFVTAGIHCLFVKDARLFIERG